MASKILLVYLVGLAVGCATVPKNAPQEFYDAQASLRRIDKVNADNEFPRTAARANASFKESLKMLRESKRDEPKYTQAEAIEKAVEAKTLADGINSLHDKIQLWDNNKEEMQGALSALEAGPGSATLDVTIGPSDLSDTTGTSDTTGNAGTTDTTTGDTTTGTTGTAGQSPSGIEPPRGFENLRGSEFVANLAYFDTGKGEEVLNLNSEALDALADILAKNPDLKVDLIGYADNRGKRSFNQTLALQRARTLAQELESRGVRDEQIKTRGQIDEGSVGAKGSRLQFSRRVQARLELR